MNLLSHPWRRGAFNIFNLHPWPELLQRHYTELERFERFIEDILPVLRSDKFFSLLSVIFIFYGCVILVSILIIIFSIWVWLVSINCLSMSAYYCCLWLLWLWSSVLDDLTHCTVTWHYLMTTVSSPVTTCYAGLSPERWMSLIRQRNVSQQVCCGSCVFPHSRPAPSDHSERQTAAGR